MVLEALSQSIILYVMYIILKTGKLIEKNWAGAQGRDTANYDMSKEFH